MGLVAGSSLRKLRCPNRNITIAATLDIAERQQNRKRSASKSFDVANAAEITVIWGILVQGRKNHRRDRIWRDFLHWIFRYFLQILGGRLTKLHINTGEKAKNPVESLQWRRRPEIADFCPLSWSNLSWLVGSKTAPFRGCASWGVFFLKTVMWQLYCALVLRGCNCSAVLLLGSSHTTSLTLRLTRSPDHKNGNWHFPSDSKQADPPK